MDTITADELKTRQMKGERLTLVNTLDPDGYDSTAIPGSVNIPLDSEGFEQRVQQMIGGKNQPIVVYCASRECPSSENAAKRLRDCGFTEVIDFEGGAKEWKEQGGTLAAES